MAEGSVLPKSHLECTICLESFKQPKLLPCHHTFCCVCLEKYVDRSKKGKKFECPLCRTETEVPRKGVAEFQTNFYIETENTKEEEIPCEGCDDDVTANHHCLDCDEHFCTRCTKSHMKMKATKHHNLMEIIASDPSVKRKIKSRVFCKKHPNEEIKVVCKECCQLLCLLCMVTDHQGHKSKELREEARKVRQNLKTTVEKKSIDETLKQERKLTSALRGTNAKLKTSLDREIKAVQDHGVQLHDAVDKVIQKIQQNLVTEYQKLMDDNEANAKLLETSSLSLQSLATTARQVVEQATDVEVIEKGSSLDSQLLAEIDETQTKEIAIHGEDDSDIFTKGDIDLEVLQVMIGSVKPHPRSSPPNITPTPIKDKLVKVDSIIAAGKEKSQVYDIAPISNDKTWVCYSESKVELIDDTGKLLLSVDAGTRVYSVTTDIAENCIFSCPTDRSIKRLTTRGKLETIVSQTDGKPYGVGYRRSSAGTEEVMFSCCGTSDGDCAVFVAPYRGGAKPVKWSSGYRNILRLVVDETTRKICIADCYRNAGYGFVVHVLDEIGQMLSKYETQDHQSFSVCFDFQGAICITSNIASCPLRRIKADGTFIEILAKVTGRVTAIDKQGRMWVGGDWGKIDIYKLR